MGWNTILVIALAAAIALYLLYADNEPSAEVYGAAADRQQASIVFDVAKQMVEMSPALMKRSDYLSSIPTDEDDDMDIPEFDDDEVEEDDDEE